MSEKRILIQVFSDIHIEVWNKIPEIPVRAKYLFLAGDICNLNHPLFFQFLDYCSRNWVKIFYITGNHEYYIKKRNYNELLFEYTYKIGEKYKNIYCLENNFVSLDEENINIYGATFWTPPPFESSYQARMYVNDYNYISYFKKGVGQVVDLDITYVRQLANDSVNNLQKYLNENDKKTIVMTHFPPQRSGTSAPKYLAEKSVKNLYFSWPDGTFQNFNLNNIVVWISGHTHWSYDFMQNGVRLIGNQLGYKSEIGETGLNEDGVYEIIVS
jgi:predicted phosphodiesterase